MHAKCVLARTDGVLVLWPKLFRPPASICACAFVKRVPVPPCLCGVADIRLLNRVGNNHDKTEVLARNRIVQIVCLGAQL